MNVSYRWLQALAPELADPPERLAHRLAMYGAPVDDLVRLGEGLADVVVARVVAVQPHPDADRLSLCMVDAGSGEAVQVVCGATNVRAGGYYPFAPVGSRLPGGVAIRKVTIRGQESRGMLCSERELGLGRDHEGILELPGGWHAGERLAPALGLDDMRLVVDVTPNRGDLLSHVGIARELAPNGHVQLPQIAGDGAPHAALSEVDFQEERRAGVVDGVQVTVEDATGCPRYLGAVVRGVTVAPSPPWLAARLRAVGLRPINNVVDATNYVLYELGQPLHAFDLRRLGGSEVRIRRARPGETMVTLDGARRTLTPEMLVIADGARPVAVAGVMGGEDSEVAAETRDVFLECAIFDPKSVRSTRTALGLSTDSSYRFERGVDPEGCRLAVRRAVALLEAVTGGEVSVPVLDLAPHPWTAPAVAVRPARASRILGAPFTARQLASYLEPLGFEELESQEEEDGEDRVWFRVPGFRSYDVAREIDLIEEVARRHGYDAFPDAMAPFRPSAVPDDAVAGLEDHIRETLVGLGFFEARTTAFAPAGEGDVALVNPLSAAESRLRRALLPGLVARLEYNFARGARHVRLFEIGTVFHATEEPGEPPAERHRLAAILTGHRRPSHWGEPSGPVEVWDLKGVLAEVTRVLGLDAGAVVPASEAEAAGDDGGETFVAGTAFVVRDAAGAVVVRGGRLPDERVDAPAWADPVWGFEVELRPEFAVTEPAEYRSLPAFPAIERDLALLVPDRVPAAEVESLIRGRGGRLLEGVSAFDVYRGHGVAPGARSIAFRLRFRAPDRTLTDAEADDAVARVLRGLEEELHVQRRG